MEYIFENRLIKDGIVLKSLKTDNFKNGILKLCISLPSADEERKTTLFGLMINVLRCGTEKYPQKSDIIKRLGDLYDASCSIGGYASGDNQIFEISSELLSDRFSTDESILDGVAELMHQLLFRPSLDDNGLFKADTVEREKRVISDRIKSKKNNSREYAFKRCREIMCEGEPYGRSIKVSVLETVTPEELTLYYREFLRSSNISFFYIGDSDPDTVAKTIKKYFISEPIGIKQPLIPMSCKKADKVREVIEEIDIKQGVLLLGFRSGVLLGNKYSDAMRVFNNIYGGTCTSRLFMTVREKMGLCYYCDSDYVSTKGLVFVSCGIDVSDRIKVQSEILNQLEMLKKHKVSSEELEVAKDMALKEIRDMQDFPGAIAAFRYSHEIYGCDTSISQKLQNIMSVTSDDILEIARMIELDTVFFLKGTVQEDEYDD